MRFDDTGVGKVARRLTRLLGQTALSIDTAQQNNAPTPAQSTPAVADVPTSLLTKARAALQQVEPMAMQGWEPAESIARQLRWCVALAADEPREERPGPFSMGLIATREFDMYGDRPELASLINEVQRGAEALLAHRP